jgi:uncharacterized protein (TIGR01244 family)
MNVKQSVTPTITIGDQPGEGDLRALREEGYVGVVNLRNDGEPEQPIGVAAEGDLVRGLGLDYLHLGVGSAPLDPEGVAAFCRFLEEHGDGKTLVHCRKGGRAAALVALYMAQDEGWPADEFAARAGTLGLKVEGGLRTLVEGYLARTGDSGG